MTFRIAGVSLLLSFALGAPAAAFSVKDIVSQAKGAAYQAAGKAATLQSFSPQGDVGVVHQARARFSDDMVRVGDPGVRNPFLVSDNCKGFGRGRWLDTRTWVYEFSDDLPALRCEFRLVAGLKSVQGKPLSAFPLYRFNRIQATVGYDHTAERGPRIVDSWPGHRGSVVEDQVFLLKLDKPTDPKSLPGNVWCLTSNLPERLPVRFLTPQETVDFVGRQTPEVREWWRKNTGQDWWDRSTNVTRRPAVKEWRAVSCNRRLTGGEGLRLVFGKAVTTAAGAKRGSDQSLSFSIRRPFTVAFSCSRQSPASPCVPLADMELRFSEVVTAEKIAAMRLQSGATSWSPEPPDPDDYDGGDASRVVFRGPFPAQAEFRLTLPPGIQDPFGRPLANAARFPLTVRTDTWPPLAKFAADFGVVETAVGAVPLTVRNLEPVLPGKTGVTLYTRRMADSDEAYIEALKQYGTGNYGLLDKPVIARQPGVTAQELPRRTSAKDFEVIGIPVTQGLYLHEVESRYLGDWISQKPQPAFVHALSLVTNLGVHVQMGRVNGLVWVTDLAGGKPVPNATVSVWDCYDSRKLWSGQTDASGLVKVDRGVFVARPDNEIEYKSGCQGSPWVIMAASGPDRSFALSEWNGGIESWRFNLYGQGDYGCEEYCGGGYGETRTGDHVMHTVFDRTLLRAGETVHMRHLVRRNKLSGISAPGADLKVKALTVRHAGTDLQFDIPVSFNAMGNASTEWAIPKAARLGEYCLSLTLADDTTLSGGCFRVSAFRLPVLKADLGLPAAPALATDHVPLQLQLQYLSGGGYSHAPVTLRGRLESDGYLVVPGFEEYEFNAVPVRAAVGQEQGDWESDDLPETVLTLDEAGGLNTPSPALRLLDRPARLRMEMEFRDPSGETQTVGAETRLWPANVMPGLRVVSSWLGNNGPVEFEVLVVGRDHKPVANAPVTVEGALLYWETHRKRTLGGYYAYDSTRREEAVAIPCGGQTDARGRLYCRTPLKRSGELRLKVIATDSEGRRAASASSVWVAGAGDWWFNQGDDDRIDVLADKKEYAVGDTARLQVRMPFREATALVSVVRDGVMDSFVTPLDGKEPVISVPVKPDYAPNVFVSVLVVRGRNNAIAPTALVDLGKPAFKLGIAQLKVGWEAYRLGVRVETDKPVYRPRDEVQATVQVTNAAARGRLPANTEVTLAVVDEALLELADNRSWDPLPSLVSARAFDVNTATNQLQVVGKRHFGKKALPAGGGGGRGGSTRELLDSLVYWQGSAPVDAEGRAIFRFPLNDSLSAFRVVAVANSRDQFGHGTASIRSTRELQVLSGLPLVVRHGDRYEAEFTVRNSSDRPQAVTLTIRSAALPADAVRQLDLAAGASQRVTLPVTVPGRVDTLAWEVRAESPDFQDSLKVSQQVLTAVPLQALAASFTQLSPGTPFSLPLDLPASSAGEGRLDLDLAATLGGSLAPVRQWFRDYPYACLEQKTTKAAGLQDPVMWQAIMADLPSYLEEATGLAAFFPGSSSDGSSFLTVHVLRLAHEMKWAIPADSRDRMLAGLEAYVLRKLPSSRYEYWIYDGRQDLTQRQMAAMSVLAAYGRFRPAMLDNLRLQPALWDIHILIDWRDLLRAAPSIPGRAARLKEVDGLIRSRLTQAGAGTMVIDERRPDRWWWYDSDEQLQARLILGTLGDASWDTERPMLVRGLVRHQRHGHWQGTQANLWGGLALMRFNEGGQPVSGRTVAAVGGQSQVKSWTGEAPAIAHPFTQAADLSLPWPAARGALTVRHEGSGKPWLRVLARAPVPVSRPDFRGYTVNKTLEPVTQKVKGEWHVGDVARVRLSLAATVDMGWVAVNDPVPAGAVLLGRGLKRDSALLAEGDSDDWWPEYVEHAADAYRAYYEFIGAKAVWSISYTVRLNQAGVFRLPATRVEAMYAPEVYGMLPNPDWVVKP